MEHFADASDSDVPDEVRALDDAVGAGATRLRQAVRCTEDRAGAVLVPAAGVVEQLVEVSRTDDKRSLQIERASRGQRGRRDVG